MFARGEQVRRPIVRTDVLEFSPRNGSVVR
jgi:hypothetical protein